MPWTTVQRTFSGKFVGVTSWNATTQGVFVDETACSRCYKCTEVASSTFEIHRTFLSDGAGWWWLWGVSLGFCKYNLFIVAFLFEGSSNFQINGKLDRELSWAIRSFPGMHIVCLFVCLIVCLFAWGSSGRWDFFCIPIHAFKTTARTWKCRAQKGMFNQSPFFIVSIAVYIKERYIDYSDYTPKHEWLEHAGTSTCLQKLMSKWAKNG